MKLAIVTANVTKGDGQARVNYEIAREALRRGHAVTLVARSVADELRKHPHTSFVPVPVAPWPTELLRNQVFALHSARWLRAHRREMDIVHVNGFVTYHPGDVSAAHLVHGAWLRSQARKATVRPGLHGAYHWFYSVVNARLERVAYRQARVVVAVSDRIRRELIACGVPEAHIRVILNGVDVEEFRPRGVARRALGLPEGVPLALFVGDIRTSLKNLDSVLSALKGVPPLHLAVVGRTEGSPYLRMAGHLGVEHRVHFLGFRRDVPDVMRAADLFVFPSRYESFSLVLLEAMASELPVVTAGTVGAADLITPECGFVVENPNDIEGLSAAMRALVETPPSRRAEMGQAARAVACRHTWSAMADAYLRLYEGIAGNEASLVYQYGG